MKKRKYKFKWNYLDQNKPKKNMSFEELLKKHLKESKSTQESLRNRLDKKKRG